MADRFEYTRITDDTFLLVLRTQNLQSPLIDHMRATLHGNAEFPERITGRPTDDLHSPTGWRGIFGLQSGTKFRVKALYVFRGFFGLVCDTEGGNHHRWEVEELLDRVNSGDGPNGVVDVGH